ncbi:MAG: TfoX/Sxy family protein [Bacteroidales bacterium]|nr:TfoX/Sxy family protein [Bacteroidales bacterium]
MEKLSDLPNIGTALEKKLIQAGIHSPSELIATGSCNAFIRLHTVDATACINSLYALEGAVQGIQWHQLDKLTKSDLLRFYRRIRSEQEPIL